MAERTKEERYWAYLEALRRRVCSVCLDTADDGTCGLAANRVCAIEQHLPRLVDTILSVTSQRMDEYVSAVEAAICGRCTEQDERGFCRLRQKGDCALSIYLPLVVDAIEEVQAAERAAS
jgi:hypothetical protein